jgi:hypothetical protein
VPPAPPGKFAQVLVGVGVGVGWPAPPDAGDGVAAQATSSASTAAAPRVATLPRTALCFIADEIMCTNLVCGSAHTVCTEPVAAVAIGFEFDINPFGINPRLTGNNQYIYPDCWR